MKFEDRHRRTTDLFWLLLLEVYEGEGEVGNNLVNVQWPSTSTTHFEWFIDPPGPGLCLIPKQSLSVHRKYAGCQRHPFRFR